jgi:hypothetical protein
MPQQQLLHIFAVATTEDTEFDSTTLPAELQLLLQEYSDLFEAPTSLPPSRACDHEIPLIPGATRVLFDLIGILPNSKTTLKDKYKRCFLRA